MAIQTPSTRRTGAGRPPGARQTRFARGGPMLLLAAGLLAGCAQTQGLQGRMAGWFDRDGAPAPDTATPAAAAQPTGAPAARNAPAPPRRPADTAAVPAAGDTAASTATADAIAAAPITVDRILGQEPAAVRSLLGAPASARDIPPAVVWAYPAPGCVVEVRFFTDLDTARRTALSVDLAAGADAADEAALAACLDAVQRRSAIG